MLGMSVFARALVAMHKVAAAAAAAARPSAPASTYVHRLEACLYK